ncbi:unnamed protein product [Camellia sinensis]
MKVSLQFNLYKLNLTDSTIRNSETELQLETLGLSGIQHCDYGLSWLWRSCKQLKKLQLRSCYAISDESSLSSFVECLIGLQEVELWTCRAIIDEQDAKEQEMKCLVVGDAAVSEPRETKSFGEEKISTSSMFETDASVPEIEKTEKQDAEAQASNDLILQDALLKPWWTDMDGRFCMDGRFWMLFCMFYGQKKVPLSQHTWMEDSVSGGQPSTCCEPKFLCEVQRKFDQRNSLLMKMLNKKINLEFETFSISVFYKRQSSQVKVLFISLLLRAFTSNLAESSDRNDNSGLSISDCMEKCWNNCSCVGFTTSNSNASPEKFSRFQIKHSRKLQNSPINGRLKRKYKGHELCTKHNELASVILIRSLRGYYEYHWNVSPEAPRLNQTWDHGLNNHLSPVHSFTRRKETILFNLARKILGKIGSGAMGEVGKAWGVEQELYALSGTLFTITALLLDAERLYGHGGFPQNQAHNNYSIAMGVWFDRLQAAFYDADNLVDEFHYEVLRRQVTRTFWS